MAQEYDSPWKEAIYNFFPHCLRLLFPSTYEMIDWSAGFKVLESELSALEGDSQAGGREADALLEVRLKNGQEQLLLVHLEVQNQKDRDFPVRMFVYYYRIVDRHKLPVASAAILGDRSPNWRPTEYRSQVGEFEIVMKWPIAKLIDLRPRIAELEESKNPFGPIVAAHLHALRTRPSDPRRTTIKVRMFRQLLEADFPPDEIRQLLRLVDWLLKLSSRQKEAFVLQLKSIKKEFVMPFIPSYLEEDHSRILEEGRQIGLEKGLEEGLEKGMKRGLEQGLEQGLGRGLEQALKRVLLARFGACPSDLEARLSCLPPEKRESLIERAVLADSLEEFQTEF